MSLETGAELNHYRIVDKLGEGGMGQVYRAVDTRLRRNVAIKVLPPELVQDGERLARMEREAQVLASLNHPHVAAIYGLEESSDGNGTGSSFLVMELVEGETLAERIAQGPVPPDQAVSIAAGIARGLEAAHEKGIVHRDLKPANVMLDADGNAKVLDFGLAKAIDGEPGAAGSTDLSMSPTIMGTQAGMILGTASYMAQEQARGLSLDKRADIWAFGCVLFEMLGGRKPFDGDTVTDIIAAVVRAEPDVDTLPAGTPPRLLELVGRCLVKDPRQRLRDIGDARIELERTDDEPLAAAAGHAEPAASRPGLLVAALAGGLAIGAIATLLLRSAPEPSPVRHALLSPDGVIPIGLAVSRDGQHIVYSQGGRAQLRSLADGTDLALEQPINGPVVAFGPDEFLYYVEGGTALRRMDVRARAPITVAETGGFWFSPVISDDGIAYVARALANSSPPVAVDAIDIGTGTVTEAVAWDVSSGFFVPAGLLEGGTALLGTGTARSNAAPEIADLRVERLDLADGTRTVIANGFGWPSLVNGDTLVMTDADGRLASVGVDPNTLQMTGVPRPRIEGLASVAFFTTYAVADDGSLFYVSGETIGANQRTLYWLDRAGAVTAVTDKLAQYDTDSTISPDGRYLAVERSDLMHVWIHDLQRDTQTPVWTDDPNAFPVWSPDGRELAVRLQPGDGSVGGYLLAER